MVEGDFKKMNKRKTVAPRTEAELESRIATALTVAFPNISRNQLSEQRRFTVRLGHQTCEFDSAAQWKKSGIADILIFLDDRPLAVLEVKRQDIKLTSADYEQVQSYANQLTPRPPLLIVTNGDETLLFDSNSGQRWSPMDDAETAVKRLLVNVGKVAVADMRWAVEALMGRETGVWAPIVRARTSALIAEMTDQPGGADHPFSRDLLFPRLAIEEVIEAIKSKSTFIIIEGAPMVGKTSLLKELSQVSATSEDFAVLMLRGSGGGLFQALANLFASELEWNLSANDARQWLRRLSNGSVGPALVIMIDCVDSGTNMAADLEELANLGLGNRLKVVLTTDWADGLLKLPNRRGKTGLGTHATQIELGPLGLVEFHQAQRVLADFRILFSDGAEYSEDYRAPWLLRSIYENTVRAPRYNDKSLQVLLPASLGLHQVSIISKIYEEQEQLLRGYRLLARDTLADSQSYSGELALAAKSSFIVRQDALSVESRDCLADLRANGWVRTYRHHGRDDVIVPTAPALFVLELGDAAGVALSKLSDQHAAGIWLGRRLDSVFLGDLIGAEAIRSLANKTGDFSSELIKGLLSIVPLEQAVERARLAMLDPKGRLIHIKIEDGKAFLSDKHGAILGDAIDLGAERMRMYADTTAWMILGQLARLATAIVGDDERRMDACILLEIGQCPFPLLRVTEEGLGHLEHDLGALGRVLCIDKAPVEAMTLAMADLLSRSWGHADCWIDTVLETDSLPLIYRVLIALRTVQKRKIPELSDWAHATMQTRVIPAVSATIDSCQ